MAKKIMPGGEPFYYRAGKIGCLLVHGFTGTPSSFQPMAEYLAKRDISAMAVRLKGHGTRVEDMHNCTYQEWVSSAEEGLKQIQKDCSHVFIAGLSMGGTLSLHLARHHPETILGVMPICAPVMLNNLIMHLVPVLKYIIKTVPAIGGDIKDPNAKEIAYERASVPAAEQLIKLTKLVKSELPSIRQPVVVFAARADAVVPPENGSHIFHNIGSTDKKLIWLSNSYHVATLDYDKEIIFEKAYDFIKRIAIR